MRKNGGHPDAIWLWLTARYKIFLYRPAASFISSHIHAYTIKKHTTLFLAKCFPSTLCMAWSNLIRRYLKLRTIQNIHFVMKLLGGKLCASGVGKRVPIGAGIWSTQQYTGGRRVTPSRDSVPWFWHQVFKWIISQGPLIILIVPFWFFL